jgi:hypothetical protein
LADGPTEKVNVKVVVRAGLLNQRYDVLMLEWRHKGMVFFLDLFRLFGLFRCWRNVIAVSSSPQQI